MIHSFDFENKNYENQKDVVLFQLINYTKKKVIEMVKKNNHNEIELKNKLILMNKGIKIFPVQ